MSLSENLHNLGALMKTNLEEKGINGLTGNEGLTTLANKILDIEGSDSSSKSIVAHVTGNSITLGPGGTRWLNSIGNVVIEWGDGTSDTVNNPRVTLSHTYVDGLNEHLIIFRGTVTSLGDECFRDCSGLTSIVLSDSVTSLGTWCFYNCSGLTSVFIPDSVTTLKSSCFDGCSGLTSIIIPDSVTDLRSYCFYECSSLIDYELYWKTQPVTYDSEKMPVNNGTVFTIPQGTTSIYTNAGYPSDRLVERVPRTLTLTCDKPIIQKTETSTVTATLKQSGSPLTGKTLNYQVKYGNTVISSGTKTTNSSGQATISYVGTGVGDVDIVVSYGTLLQETYELQDCNFHDLASQSNLSKYTANGDTNITYDSTNSAYLLQKSTFGFSSITLNDYRFTNNIKIEADIMLTGSDTNIQCGIGLLNGDIGVDCKLTYYSPDSYYALTCIESTRTSYGSNEVESRVSSINLNNWYHYIVEINGSNINVKVYDGDVLFATLSTSKSVLNETNNELAFWIGFGINSKALIKNIKVKAL